MVGWIHYDLLLRYLYNFYSFLNFENQHYREQWEWLDKELSIASAQGEKVFTVFYLLRCHQEQIIDSLRKENASM